MKIFESIGATILAVALFAALVLALAFGGLEMKRYFKPRHAEIDRQVFEQTPSFVHGKAQYLSRLRAQYETAKTEASRTTLRTLIITEASTVSSELLPRDLQAFLKTL